MLDDKRKAEIDTLLLEASPEPWQLQTSCSWRRIGRKYGGRDGDVLRPTYDRDGHPNLNSSPGNLALIEAAPTVIRELRDEVDRLTVVAAWMADCHAANAEYDAQLKSCSKSRRQRFMDIARKCASYLKGEERPRGSKVESTIQRCIDVTAR